ncbi:MAG: hypothetical protein V3U65_01760 [Granulosicoccaceae bacterium]
MPRSLTFTLGAQTVEAQLIKVDRKQLYGSVSVETRDSNDARCQVATLAEDGKTLIPRGGTALGYVNPDGEWVTRDQLTPVDLQGNPLDQVESSFEHPIELSVVDNIEHFLDHNVRLSYRLNAKSESSDGGFPEEWTTQLEGGVLFEFGFSYRGGIGLDPAFILCDDDDNIWLLITQANDVQFVSLEQAAVCAGEALIDEVEDGEEESALDFGML